jgi:cold shock CspA family protein
MANAQIVGTVSKQIEFLGVVRSLARRGTKINRILDEHWDVIDGFIVAKDMHSDDVLLAFLTVLQEQNTPPKAFGGIVNRLSNTFSTKELLEQLSESAHFLTCAGYQAAGIAALEQLNNAAIEEQQLHLSWFSVLSMSRVSGLLNKFLGVPEVAHLKQVHRSLDACGELHERLRNERAAYHTGLIKIVNCERQYGFITSDAGRDHVVLFPDIQFHVEDGTQFVSFECDIFAQRFHNEPKDVIGLRVCFDLQRNVYKGQLKPLKAVNVVVKLLL